MAAIDSSVGADVFRLEVLDDSMEPLVRPGQTVVVDRRLPVRSGDLAVVDLAPDDGVPEWVLKRVEIVAGAWNLVSINPAAGQLRLEARPRQALAVVGTIFRELAADWVPDEPEARGSAAERTYRETPEQLREREDRETDDRIDRFAGDQ